MCEWEKNCNDADVIYSVTGVNTLNVIVQSSTADEKERGSNLLVMRILLLSAFKRMLYGNLTLKWFTAESQLCHNSEEML